MAADHYFKIGSSHTVCEDYARSGIGHEGPYAIVSDGCSSSKDSDIGARVLSLMTERVILHTDIPDPYLFLRKLEDNVRSYLVNSGMLTSLGLQTQCMDATVVFATQVKDKIVACIYGDGFLVLKKKDQTIIHEVSYASGYPNYFSYRLDEKRMELVKSRLVKNVNIVCSAGIQVEGQLSKADATPYALCFDKKDIEVVAVMSDGLSSFVKKEVTLASKVNTPVPYKDVVKDIVEFKGTNGVFIQRTIKKLLKDYHAKGIEHLDDFSIAAFSVKHEGENNG